MESFPRVEDTDKEAPRTYLRKNRRPHEENKEWLAQVETMDNGKPIRETSTIDIPYSIRHFRYKLIRTDEGTASVLDGNMMSLVLREPIGVVGQIVPWNFPFLMAAWKLAPAIAAGDCIVFDLLRHR